MFKAVQLSLKMDIRRRYRHRLNASFEASTSARATRNRLRRSGRIVTETNDGEVSNEDIHPASNLSDTESMESSSSNDSTETLSESDSDSNIPVLRRNTRNRSRTTRRQPRAPLRVSDSDDDTDFTMSSSTENSADGSPINHLNSDSDENTEDRTSDRSSDSQLTVISSANDRTSDQSSDSELTVISSANDRTEFLSDSRDYSSTDSDLVDDSDTISSTRNQRSPTPMSDLSDDPIETDSDDSLEPQDLVASSTSKVVSQKSNRVSEPNKSISEDDGITCPICFELWSNSGEHRMASLKCGHIFGKSCIERWLQSAGKCPSCNAKGTKKDIRIIYAGTLKAVDTCEKDRLAQELQQFKSKVEILEREKVRILIKSELDAQQMRKFQEELRLLKNSMSDSNVPVDVANDKNRSRHKLARQTTFDLTKDGSTRVMAFNDWMSMLVVSVPTQLALFPGFGIRKINVLDMKLDKYVALHSKAIRDLAFNPSRQDLLLSVSLDKTIKILNVSNNNVIHTYTASQPLWSCCWNSEKSREFFVGGSNGIVYVFNTSMSSSDESKTSHTVSGSGPIVSLCYIARNETDGHQSGLLVTKLNSITFIEFCKDEKPNLHRLILEGPFVHCTHDPVSSHIMVTCRPSQRNEHARHIICRLQGVNISNDPDKVVTAVSVVEVHTLQGGTTMRVLSRSCLTPDPNNKFGTLAIFSEENSQMSKIYDMASAKLIQRLKTNTNVIDCLHARSQTSNYLVLLSEKNVTFYKWIKT